MRVIITALGCAAVCIAGSASAQTTPMAPAAAVLAPVSDGPMLRVGTKVPLRLNEELTTKGKKLRVGQQFRMETTEPVMVNSMVVIPAGSPATGEITEVKNKGMWGKSGHLTAQMSYVTVGGRQVRMTGTFDDKGTAGGIGAAAVSAVVFLPAGFFMTGTSAHIPMGAPVIGFIGEDVPLAMAAAPTPLVVSPPATIPPPISSPTVATGRVEKSADVKPPTS